MTPSGKFNAEIRGEGEKVSEMASQRWKVLGHLLVVIVAITCNVFLSIRSKPKTTLLTQRFGGIHFTKLLKDGRFVLRRKRRKEKEKKDELRRLEEKKERKQKAI